MWLRHIISARHRRIATCVCLALAAFGCTADRASGTQILYISDDQPGFVKSVGPAGGAADLYLSGFNQPFGLAFDAVGALYVVNASLGSISRIAPGSGTVTTIITGLRYEAAYPNFLTIDPAGNLYVRSAGARTILQVPTNGDAPRTYTTGMFVSPAGMAFDSLGNLYVADEGTSEVYVVGPGGGSFSLFATGFDNPWGLAIDSRNNVFVSNRAGNSISEVGPGGGVAHVFATGFNSPLGLAFDNAGNLYVADELNHQVDVILAGTNSPLIFADNVFDPAGLAFNPATSVPESSSGLLAAGGLIGLAAFRQRRRFR